MATEQQVLTQWREYFDTALSNVGVRAPPPVLGQAPDDYVRETCRTLKRQHLPQNHEYYRVNYRGLRADALTAIVPQLVEAVKVEAVNPANLQPGEIKPIEKRGPDGQKWIDWVGRESFVKDMTRPGRRVVSFTTSNGRYDAVKGRYF